MIADNLDPQFVRTIDVAAGASILATIVGALPSIAALIGIIWYLLLIYESKTVQGMVERRRKRKALRRRHTVHKHPHH